jgi:hypothetical protein
MQNCVASVHAGDLHCEFRLYIPNSEVIELYAQIFDDFKLLWSPFDSLQDKFD